MLIYILFNDYFNILYFYGKKCKWAHHFHHFTDPRNPPKSTLKLPKNYKKIFTNYLRKCTKNKNDVKILLKMYNKY